ncbi:MAG: hypothetical protein ABEI98_01060 [Halorhabdus sp.]
MPTVPAILVGVLSTLRGLVNLFGGIGMVFMGTSFVSAGGLAGMLFIVGIVSFVLGIGYAVVAVGLFTDQRWATTGVVIVFGLAALFRLFKMGTAGAVYPVSVVWLLLDLVIVGWSQMRTQPETQRRAELSRTI